MSQGWQIGLIMIGLVTTGCGPASINQNVASGESGGWSHFPVPIYADATVMSSNQTQSDFMDAMSFWEKRAGRKLFDYRGEWTGSAPYQGSAANPTNAIANVLLFQNGWPFGSGIAGRTTTFFQQNTIQSGVIMINPNLTYCKGDCAGQGNLTSERNTFTHELGHFLGMSHVQDPNDIMNPVVIKARDLSVVSIDQATLDRLTR